MTNSSNWATLSQGSRVTKGKDIGQTARSPLLGLHIPCVWGAEKQELTAYSWAAPHPCITRRVATLW